MSVVALSVDALLPALDVIGAAIGTQQTVDNQLLIIMIFLGLGIGPLIFGPISDASGRKPSVYMGFVVFLIASAICVYAESLEVMVAGRILQGIGLSAPRTICIAIIRDMYSGDYMARIMSFVTVVFLLVPIVAPALGKWILDHYDWETIFYVQVVISLIIVLWFWLRQPETLPEERRMPFTPTLFSKALKEIIQYRQTMGYTFISGFIVGAFMVYLSASQQIFEEFYGLKEEFPYIFAGLAITIGSAIFLNGTLVLRLGMERLVTWALYMFFLVSIAYLVFYGSGTKPSLTILLVFFGAQFFAIGFLFGNIRALAMQPVGHIAGNAAAITGFISTIMAVPISTFIGRFLETSTLPVFLGFAVCSGLSVLLLWYTKRGKIYTDQSSKQ